MLKLVLFSVLFACAYAQLSYTTLTAGTPYSGTIPIAADLSYGTQYYAVWAPFNLSQINITLLNGNGCDVRLSVRTTGWTCSEAYYYNYLCYQGYEDYAFTQDYIYVIADGYESEIDNDQFQFTVNNWYYITIERESDLDYATACGFTLFTELTECSGNNIGVAPTGTLACVPYTNVTATSNAFVIPNQAYDTYAFFVTDIPDFTGSIYLWANSTSTDLYLEGYGQGAPGYDYNCYESTYTTNGSFYIYELVCPTPRSGLFFFSVYSTDSNAINTNVVFILDWCNTTYTGLGGANCNMPALPLNFTYPGPYVVPGNVNSPSGYGFYYMYMYSPPFNTSFLDVTFCIVNANDSGYVYFRRNAFPESTTEWGYEGSYNYVSFGTASSGCLYMRLEDFFVGGFFYVGVSNEGAGTGQPLSFNIAFNYTIAQTSAATSVSGTGVTGGVTGGNTGVTGATGGNTGVTGATGGVTGGSGPTGGHSSADAFSLGVSVLVVLIAVILSF